MLSLYKKMYVKERRDEINYGRGKEQNWRGRKQDSKLDYIL